ncbi:hypothetical protein [Kordiimonas marina]|uniref:hypothetical protein n=1 Tax=Kordiimonas marina TaxID=2872312 RepID=UPI001FF52CE8|nr:hypothetical protein [Kordiimonas marina]MCJ9429660.1 hypothetical protein [Kordiimonas marina]
MSRFRIEATQRYLLGGVELLVTEVSDCGRIIFEAVETGHRHVLRREEAEKEILSGELILKPDSDGSPVVAKTPLDLLPPNQKAEVLRKERYLLELRDTDPQKSFRSKIVNVIEKVATDLGDENPPKPTTVYRWYKR